MLSDDLENIKKVDETLAPAPEAALSSPELAAKTLAGDLRDQMLELVRDLREPWHKAGEKQQRYFAERVSDRCMVLVTKAVGIVAAHDFPALPATIKTSKLNDSIEATLVFSRYDQHRHKLLDATGAEVTLILADARAFLGARAAPAIDKDEPELPIAGAEAEPEVATGVASVNNEARQDGVTDGRLGVRDHAARWPSGQPGHADYELGRVDGDMERKATLIEARRLGAVAGKAGTDGSENPYPFGSEERDEWAGGWLEPEPGNNGGFSATQAEAVEAVAPRAPTGRRIVRSRAGAPAP